MIISPEMLREQVRIKIVSMLQRSKEKDIQIETPIQLESWRALQTIKDASIASKSDFNIVSVMYSKDREAYVNVKNKGNLELQIGLDLLNIENMYQLYSQLSSILTTIAPAYNPEMTDEM